VAKLPARQQQVIRLHYFNGLQFVDIAEAMGITKGRVSQLHKEGLEQLRRMLKGGAVDWCG
jgi:RNA polymerase sigma factor for flagellar operon FliA